MDQSEVAAWAKRLLAGEAAADEFVRAYSNAQSARLPEVTLDLGRGGRCGYPEVVYGEGKTNEALLAIFRTFQDRGIDGFATRISTEQAEKLHQSFPNGQYNSLARTFRLPNETVRPSRGQVAVVSAGTSDAPVAAEASETARWMGAEVLQVADVGVAGPHRLPERLPELGEAGAIVVVAGMEGALPSVVGGYVSVPVIAVPTSVGYGANFGGLAALLGMLNSCAANVVVVNIDAGFKAGYVAAMIAAQSQQEASPDGE